MWHCRNVRRSWLLASAGLMIVVVLIGRNSGPVTSTQAIRAARTTPSSIEAPSAPFCRAIAASAQPFDPGHGYVGSAEQLAALSHLEDVATPTVRFHLSVVRHYFMSGDRSDVDPQDWPEPVQSAAGAVETFTATYC